MGNRLYTNKKFWGLFLIAFTVCSCHSLKNYEYKHLECYETPKEAVDIAIADYSHALKKQKEISDVVAVYIYIFPTSTDWFYISMVPWRLHVDDSSQYYLADKFPIEFIDKNMGHIPPSWIPTDYVEKDNVLYVWHDPQIVLTEEMKRLLNQYDLIYYSGDLMSITTGSGDISYIFCKYNYKKKYYRKIKAPYLTPLPSCGCK